MTLNDPSAARCDAGIHTGDARHDGCDHFSDRRGRIEADVEQVKADPLLFQDVHGEEQVDCAAELAIEFGDDDMRGTGLAHFLQELAVGTDL